MFWSLTLGANQDRNLCEFSCKEVSPVIGEPVRHPGMNEMNLSPFLPNPLQISIKYGSRSGLDTLWGDDVSKLRDFKKSPCGILWRICFRKNKDTFAGQKKFCDAKSGEKQDQRLKLSPTEDCKYPTCTYCLGETNPAKSHDYGLEKWKLLPMVAVTSNAKRNFIALEIWGKTTWGINPFVFNHPNPEVNISNILHPSQT